MNTISCANAVLRQQTRAGRALAGIRRHLAALLACAGSALPAMPMSAAEFPADKPVTIVVPFAPGEPTDQLVRELAQTMSKSLGQTVLVENVVGAGGTIGTRKVAVATKDGYTLLVHTMGMSIAPSLYKDLSFDVLKDFDYIGQIVDVPMVILGNRNFPPKDFRALLKHISDNPGRISIGHAGPGSSAHLCTLLLQNEVKTKMVPISYKGSAPALSDVIGGQVDLACVQTSSTSSPMKAGLVKPYAITTLNRASSFDHLPTASEQGLPGFDVKTWHGMYAPKGIPQAVHSKLVAALKASLRDEGFRLRMAELGGQIVSAADASPESLKAKLAAETARWALVIRKTGVQPH